MAPRSLDMGGWTPTLALTASYVLLVTLQIAPLATSARLLAVGSEQRLLNSWDASPVTLNDEHISSNAKVKWQRVSRDSTGAITPNLTEHTQSAMLDKGRILPWPISPRIRRDLSSANEVPTELDDLVDQLPHEDLTETADQIENRTSRRPARETEVIPQYMLDLYSHYARNKREYPSTNIIRSFANIYPESGLDLQSNGSGIRRLDQLILFDIQSISLDETIQEAELRVWCVLPERRQPEVELSLTLYYVRQNRRHRWRKKALVTKQLRGSLDKWIMFNITEHLKLFHRRGETSHILALKGFASNAETRRHRRPTIKVRGSQVPFLLVFSDPLPAKPQHRDRQPKTPNSTTRNRTPRAEVSGEDGEDGEDDQDGEVLRREKRGKSNRRNICRRKQLTVDFENLHWSNWIIAPKTYQAYECVGRCYFPFSEHLTPTRHAIVQTLLHTNNPDMTSRACCVPTRLESISLLYLDKGAVTYEYNYEDMVVAECGCR